VSLRKPLGKVQLLVGLPASKELVSHCFSSFSYLPFRKERKICKFCWHFELKKLCHSYYSVLKIPFL